MKYTVEDINFENISPKQFENLCYDLLVNYNFRNLIWREGGADNGRDIEANQLFNNAILEINTKWFFECKHYNSGGVPPNDLSSKLTWADAERPDYLVFFISSYLTNNAREWLEKIKSEKRYKIFIIEGQELKRRIVQYNDLVERYFSIDKYENLFKTIKDFKTKFDIKPSFEFIDEIIQNIDLAKLDTDDFSFILLNFYSQYRYFETKNEVGGDFSEDIIYKLLEFLSENISNKFLESFNEYKDNYDTLAGDGIFDEMELIGEDLEECGYELKKYNFQYYVLHLNPSMNQDKWKTAEYLFIKYKKIAFEIFNIEKAEIRIILDFNGYKFNELSIALWDGFDIEYKKYLSYFDNKS